MLLLLLFPLGVCSLVWTRPLDLVEQITLATPSDPAMVLKNESVPGNNNATFCGVPRAEQLFHVDFLDIAPFPIPV
jgi:hypothetical protein